jgi:Sec-independent protein translocase protein TatA
MAISPLKILIVALPVVLLFGARRFAALGRAGACGKTSP